MLSVYVGGLYRRLISAHLPRYFRAHPFVCSLLPLTPSHGPQRRTGARAFIGVWASFFCTVIFDHRADLCRTPLALFCCSPWPVGVFLAYRVCPEPSWPASGPHPPIARILAGLDRPCDLYRGGRPDHGPPAALILALEMLQAGLPFLVVLIGIFRHFANSYSGRERRQRPVRAMPLVTGCHRLPDIGRLMKEVLMRRSTLLAVVNHWVLDSAPCRAGGHRQFSLPIDQAKRDRRTARNSPPVNLDESSPPKQALCHCGRRIDPVDRPGHPGSALTRLMASTDGARSSSVPVLILDHGDLVYGMFIAMVVASFIDADRGRFFPCAWFLAGDRSAQMA